MQNEIIDIPPETSTAIALRPESSVGRAMTVDELHNQLEFIRQVMRTEMREGQDYGKIPGTGEKPTLLQPGAQKLLMTFNLTETVKKEVLREYPGMHREYEFTVEVRAGNGKAWDGVGTCTTLESKYRYRKAERKCPKCGKSTIIQGKSEYGGGWVCWKKKGGCDAKFGETEPLIVNQPGGAVENEDPADCWNTVRKMAFKRALVAAAINATNTSELWTQDLEDIELSNVRKSPTGSQNVSKASEPVKMAPGGSQASKQAAVESFKAEEGGFDSALAPARDPASAKPSTPSKLASEAHKQRMLECLHAIPNAPGVSIVTEYFQAVNALLPGSETLADLKLQWVPTTPEQMNALAKAIADFENGDPAVFPWKVDHAPEAAADKPHVATVKAKDPEWFWKILISVPRRGMKKAEYERQPDTIESLYKAMKSGDKESQKRLFGMTKWVPAPREYNGKVYQPTEADLLCKKALDAFVAWEKQETELLR